MNKSRKTIDLKLAIRHGDPPQTVKAYEVLPGLFAHKLSQGTWRISHHSGYSTGCHSNTLKECRRIAHDVQTIYPIDWTQGSEEISAILKMGRQWVDTFMRIENGYSLDEYVEEPYQEEEPHNASPPGFHLGVDQLYWQGEPVWMPDDETLKQWFYDGICESLDGHRVELDGHSPNGAPSYFIALGMI